MEGMGSLHHYNDRQENPHVPETPGALDFEQLGEVQHEIDLTKARIEKLLKDRQGASQGAADMFEDALTREKGRLEELAGKSEADLVVEGLLKAVSEKAEKRTPRAGRGVRFL